MSAMTTAAPAGRQWQQACRLAFRDFLHEWRVSLCLIFALAAVLAPLLVLFGLKSGIIATMTERLRADPHNLEITLRGHQRLDRGGLPPPAPALRPASCCRAPAC